MEPDLSASITLHPRPFRLVHAPPSRSSNPGPGAAGLLVQQPQGDADASTTALEAMAAQDAAPRHPPGGTDVESQTTAAARGRRLPRFTEENDPYGLSSAYKTETDLAAIKANTGRKRANGPSGPATATGVDLRGPPAGIFSSLIPLRSRRQAHRVASFYESQNVTIERLLKSVEEHRAEARQEAGDDHLRYQIGVYGSFIANVVLAALQLYGAVSSGSLSLFTTMADSIFDPLSNLTLILTNRAVRHVDPSRFPSGKARLETVGNIVFCFLMTAVSFILIAFSAKELSDRHGEDGVNGFHLPSVVAVAIAFATKLALFLYTWALKDKYSQIFILWQDHRNDLAINGFGVMTSVLGSKLIWWIDPLGAVVLSVVISAIWLRTAFMEFMLLVGVVASVETQQLITYVCVTHSPAVRQIDTVRVYHSGPRLIAEVDIVMDPEETLAATHDVAEALQFKLESLPDVERAYVHVDYETTHKPEHAYKKDL